MNFTREPIIETIISPREGFKLLVRSSKGGAAEEYYVDAVEVVTFGRALFFRSLERPKPFVVPATDYEVLEVKEARVALKNVSHERNIKIGGGRDASMRPSTREAAPERETESHAEEGEPVAAEGQQTESSAGGRSDKRRDRHRRRRRRGGSDEQEWSDRRPAQESPNAEQPRSEGGGQEDEAKVSSPIFSRLIPPPTTLISETFGHLKDKESAEGTPPQKAVEEKKNSPPEEPGESAPLHREMQTQELPAFTSTNFSSLFF
ncbi:MAG: hypothetical protein JSS61_02270 [Verrucomicrobia bacterium]|nr:hypothetical protein [Verrucomicrobiota bacterium]